MTPSEKREKLLELAPCPFCGSKNVDSSFARGYTGGDTTKSDIAAGCFDCGCTGPTVSVPANSNGYEQAIAAWNKRAAETMKEGDAKRINWLESQANVGRFELTRSLLKGGYEFGFWPRSGPIAEVHAGSLRDAIDKSMLASRPKEKEE